MAPGELLLHGARDHLSDPTAGGVRRRGEGGIGRGAGGGGGRTRGEKTPLAVRTEPRASKKLGGGRSMREHGNPVIPLKRSVTEQTAARFTDNSHHLQENQKRIFTYCCFVGKIQQHFSNSLAN